MRIRAHPHAAIAAALAVTVTVGLCAQSANPPPRILDRPVDAFRVFLGGDIDRAFQTLAQHVKTPMGIEMLPRGPRTPPSDPRVLRQPAPATALALGPGTLDHVLQVLLDRRPEYEMTIDNRVVDIIPRALRTKQSHFLDVPLDHFEVADTPIRQAIRVLRHAMNPAFSDRPSSGYGGTFMIDPTRDNGQLLRDSRERFERHVSVVMDHATPRQILNSLVAAHGDVFWSVEYRPRGDSGPVEAQESTCTMFINTFADIGMALQFDPVLSASSTPRVTPPPASPPLRTLGSGPRVLVRIPTDAQGLFGAVQTLARSAKFVLGVEIVAVRRDVSDTPPPPATRDMFDLTGLAVPAALDKILSTMPDYLWRKDGEVYHVQPKAFAGNRMVALSQHVDTFEHRLASPLEAIVEVHALMGFRPTPRPSTARPAPSFPPFTEKPVALSLMNVTVRDVLDAIALQGRGDILWRAEYADAAGGASGIRLGLNGVNVTRPR